MYMWYKCDEYHILRIRSAEGCLIVKHRVAEGIKVNIRDMEEGECRG